MSPIVVSITLLILATGLLITTLTVRSLRSRMEHQETRSQNLERRIDSLERQATYQREASEASLAGSEDQLLRSLFEADERNAPPEPYQPTSFERIIKDENE